MLLEKIQRHAGQNNDGDDKKIDQLTEHGRHHAGEKQNDDQRIVEMREILPPNRWLAVLDEPVFAIALPHRRSLLCA